MLLLIYYARNVLVLYNNPVYMYCTVCPHVYARDPQQMRDLPNSIYRDFPKKVLSTLLNKPAYTTSLLDASNDFYCPLWPPLTSNGLQWTSKCFNNLQWSWIFCHWIVHVRLFGTFQALLDEKKPSFSYLNAPRLKV